MKTIILLCSSLILVVSGCSVMKESPPPPQMSEVERLRASFPVYPGMTQVPDDFRVAAPNIAALGLSFKSNASYDDVSRFYIKELTSAGWELTSNRKLSDWGRDLGGHELEFQKGEYHISIEKGGSNNDDWDYGVNFSWRSPQEKPPNNSPQPARPK